MTDLYTAPAVKLTPNTKLAYFIEAMKAELYRNRAWVFSAFAVVQEAPDSYKKDPYPYRLVQTPTSLSYVNPNNPSELVAITDHEAGQVPFAIKDRIPLSKGQVPNLYTDIESNYGNLLANFIVLVYPFGGKIPYIEKRFSPSLVEGLILPLLTDDPADPKDRSDRLIYTDEYLKFTNAMSYLAAFASLWVTGGTKKSLLPPPGVKEYRNSLIAKYTPDQLKDPANIAVISKQLQEFDAAWLKGDDAENMMLSAKSREVVRAKKFLMVGAEVGLNSGVDVELIPNSLHEGWDIQKFPAMNNNLRAGSYNRGAQTMLGGESVKWLLRGSSNINIVEGDCGSKLGRRTVITKDNFKRYLGFTIITATGLIKLEDTNITDHMDKVVYVRSPLYCKQSHTDYCSVCAGPRLAANPTGASSAISDYGSAMLLIMMKAMHGKPLTLAHYDYKKRLM